MATQKFNQHKEYKINPPIFLGLLALFFSNLGIANTNIKEDLIGIWAMDPMYDGTANVVEFKPNGVAKLYSYTCDLASKKALAGPIEQSQYVLMDNVISLTVIGTTTPYTKIRVNYFSRAPIALNNDSKLTFLSLTQFIDHQGKRQEWDFLYSKSTTISPLCDLYFSIKAAR